MDSSPVLRQQSHNKIRSDFLRMKNEHNKKPADPKPFKHLSHLPNKDTENQDPGSSEIGRKAPVRPGVSKLPVLAKSLRLQTPSDFTQSHCRWEDKPLAGKTKKKRPCTRPVPFNLSQPKSSRMLTETPQPQTVSQSRTDTHAGQPKNNACDARLKTQNINAKPSEYPALLKRNGGSSKGAGRSHGKATENTFHLSGQSNTFKTNNAMYQNSAAPSAQAAISAEACLDNLNLLSLTDPSKTSHVSQNISKDPSDKGEKFEPDHAALLSVLRNEGCVSVMKSRQKAGPTTGVSGSVKSVQFSPDPAALKSILLNEGVKAGGPVGATPRNSVCPPGRGTSIYTPQRVSVMKSRQKTGPTTGVSGSVKSVQFSPDPAALKSILLNEGVKAGGPVGATPRNSVCPPGRGTSIYTAQRVPVKNNCAETIGGPVAMRLKDTPSKKWTPQRVRDTKNQPMSSVKWHLSTPYTGLRHYNTNQQPCQEEVIQKLFDDQEEEQSTNVADKDPETRAEQLPVQASKIKSYCEENVETSRTNSEEDEENKQIMGRQPFFQAPQRGSVIFFSTGKTLIRAPCFEKQESSAYQEQQGPVSPEQGKLLRIHEGKSSVSEPTCQIKSLHRDLTVQKTCALSPAVALLRRRLPPLEELRMDEEVATFTSVSVPAAPVSLPPQPRCGNPLASILHFEESTRFVPVDFDLSASSSSPHSSPLHER